MVSTADGGPGSMGLAEPSESDRAFARILDRREISVVFQPLVDLNSGVVVALESLARGPEGTAFASPLALFEAARRVGRVAELDWVCRAAAFRAFLDADLPSSMSLFVNVDPEAFGSTCPTDLASFVSRAESLLRVYVEINDRALAADPAGVLSAVDRARERGWGIAIDDVGASRAPVAMLPIVLADVVKLDLRRIADARPEDTSAIITSVLRHVESTGASLLVERIETEQDARWARALGATYGQGDHLGAAGPLQARYATPRSPMRLLTAAVQDVSIGSPFALFADRPHQRVDFEALNRIGALVAFNPRSSGTWPVFLAGMSRDEKLPEPMVEHILGLPRQTLLFVTFGTRLPNEPVSGVRGVRLREGDPLADERFFIILSDQAPIAFFARDAPGGLFDIVVTQDSATVNAIAHHLIRRIPGPGLDNTALPLPASSDDPWDADDDAPPDEPARHGGWRSRRRS